VSRWSNRSLGDVASLNMSVKPTNQPFESLHRPSSIPVHQPRPESGQHRFVIQRSTPNSYLRNDFRGAGVAGILSGNRSSTSTSRPNAIQSYRCPWPAPTECRTPWLRGSPITFRITPNQILRDWQLLVEPAWFEPLIRGRNQEREAARRRERLREHRSR
jgi:hypothetical protein